MKQANGRICSLHKLFFMIFTIISCSSQGKIHQLFDSISVKKNQLNITVSKKFKQQFLHKKTLNFTYADSVNLETLDASIINAGAIMCLAPMVWISQEQYEVDVMDYDLYESLKKIRHIYKLFYPRQQWDGEIIPRTIVKNRLLAPRSNDNVVILFSGGLDSTTSSFYHLDKHQLLITIGGKDSDLNHPTAWHEVKKYCNTFAKRYGHDFDYVTFNLDDIIKKGYLNKVITDESDWWAAALGSLTHVGAILPLAFLNGYQQIIFASARTIERPDPFGNHPLIDNNLICASIKTIHDGGGYTRPEKIGIIVEHAKKFQVPLPHLRVCETQPRIVNCCTCPHKCINTYNDLFAMGQDPNHFGFNKPHAELITTSKKHLQKSRLTESEWWRLTTTQKYIRLGFAQNLYQNFSSEVQEYLRWFMNFDLDKHYQAKLNDYIAYRDLYTHLWKLAYYDPFNELMNISHPLWATS